MSRLKIALVANNIHFRGGMERYCAELATFLCKDHDVHLFASEIADVPLNQMTVHPVRTVRKPVLALFAQYYLKSSRQIRLRDYDIVHSIGGITAHQNFVTAQYCQHAWGDAIQREPGAAEGINPYHQFMWRLTGYFEKRAMTSPETLGISANSRRTQNDLEHYYGCNPAKIGVIYNAVDSERFHPANTRYRQEVRKRYGISEDALVVLFVGEYRRKGLASLIRALGKIADPRVHLLAVGKGDVAQYQALAAEAKITPRVTFAGPTGNIEHVFGAADLFAFPTYYEAFGMVITEAMASELPVITSRSAGAAEMIEAGKSGLLLERPGDADELSEKLAILAEDKALRLDMGREARLAVSAHRWADVGEETLRLYQKGLGQASSSVISPKSGALS